jgi:hypothetical protein
MVPLSSEQVLIPRFRTVALPFFPVLSLLTLMRFPVLFLLVRRSP